MPNPTNYYVHPKALVDEGAEIGENTRIWAFAHVMGGAKLGSHCNIGNYAFVENGAVLGDRCTVKNGVQIWEGVVAEDKVFFGPNCVLTNDMFPRSGIHREKKDWFQGITLKEGCTLGANSTVVPGVTVGRYAYVVAGAVATKDVPDHAIVIGVPARFHAWICRCGAKLRFSESRASCKCGDVYTLDEAKATVRLQRLP